MERGVVFVVMGILSLVAAGLISRPSIALAPINDLAAILGLFGAGATVWGVVLLKKQKDERLRQKRREN